jgi:hypothetical protein
MWKSDKASKSHKIAINKILSASSLEGGRSYRGFVR